MKLLLLSVSVPSLQDAEVAVVSAFTVVLATTTAQTTMLSHGDSDHDDDETGRYSR